MGVAHFPENFIAVDCPAAVRVFESLPEIINRAYEKGKTDSLAVNAEDARKAAIKSGLPPGGKKPSGGDNKTTLSATEMEAVKRVFGNNPTKAQLATYAKLVGAKNARTITVEG